MGQAQVFQFPAVRITVDNSFVERNQLRLALAQLTSIQVRTLPSGRGAAITTMAVGSAIVACSCGANSLITSLFQDAGDHQLKTMEGPVVFFPVIFPILLGLLIIGTGLFMLVTSRSTYAVEIDGPGIKPDQRRLVRSPDKQRIEEVYNAIAAALAQQRGNTAAQADYTMPHDP